MKKVTLFCAAALFSLLSFAQNDKGDIVKTGDKMPAFTPYFDRQRNSKFRRLERESSTH